MRDNSQLLIPSVEREGIQRALGSWYTTVTSRHVARTSEAGQSPPSLDRLRPVAEQVDALTRASSRAVVDGDAELATAVLAAGGERALCDSALHAAWADILGGKEEAGASVAADVSLLVTLEKIADLAVSICRAVIGLADGRTLPELPSIRQLAVLVPEMLRDALGAVRENDRSSAERVLGRGLAVDTCFAQAHMDVLQVARQGTREMDVARQFHMLGRALERIGDGASEIAASVRPVALHEV